MNYAVVRAFTITLSCILLLSIVWLFVRSIDQGGTPDYTAVVQEARQKAYEAAQYFSTEMREYERSMIILDEIDYLNIEHYLFGSEYELTYPARIHARTPEGTYILLSEDYTMKMELEKGGVWDSSTESETIRRYGAALYHYDEAEEAWSSGEPVEQFEPLDDVDYPSHSLFFPVQDAQGTFLLLEIIPDYSRLFYRADEQTGSRNAILLTVLITALVFGLPILQHLLYGDPNAAVEKSGRWIPSWLRIRRGDYVANYLFLGVGIFYPPFIYGLLFFDVYAPEVRILKIFLVFIWVIPFFMFFMRGILIRRVFAIGEAVDCKLQGQEEVLLGYGHAMQGVKERVVLFGYRYHGEEHTLRATKTKQLIAEAQRDDFAPVAMVHPGNPKRAILRNNFT